MTQVGAPAIGEVLADRYRIEQHVNDDSTGRQVWRGVDVILQRPVTIVLRSPGGVEADEMLSAAVAASRVVHPNIVGVYDAIDEGSRAYVIREWVEGHALRDVVLEAPLEPSRAIAVARAVADALSAVHATGVCHGNVHPGTVLLSVDGRVVLGDARANDQATAEGDVRAVGATLYCGLTGHWPPGIGPSRRAALPEAPILENGTIPSPGQLSGGVPEQLDTLTMRLLDPSVPAPGAAELALELARLGFHEPSYHHTAGYPEDRYHAVNDAGPLGFVGVPQAGPARAKPATAKPLVVVVAGLVAVVLAVLLVATSWSALFGPDSGPPSSASGGDSQGNKTGQGAGEPRSIDLTGDMVRMVDPPKGDRTEGNGTARAVDGDPTSGWPTQEYTSPRFGNLKPGMGLLINLGKAQKVSAVNLKLSAPGARVSIRYGDQDYGDTSQGDDQIAKDFTEEVESRQIEATAEIPVDVETQYLLVWITELPPYENGTSFKVQINEIQLISGVQ
ncbi:MAG TPA: protein kinase family protein [Micromonosporaceae bacterium]